MNDELIERLAREAGIADPGDVFLPAGRRALARFAALVAEQCAKTSEAVVWWEHQVDGRPADDDEGHKIAAALIRAAFPMPKD